MKEPKRQLINAKENQGPMGRGKKLDSLFDNPKKPADEPFELAKADQKRKGHQTASQTVESTSEELDPIDNLRDDEEDELEGESLIVEDVEQEKNLGSWEAQATNDGSTEQVSNDPQKAQQQTPHYPED